ncbi:hypothetical protein FA13DRAFT_81998 [Coprinellus micaceus]|uniref:Uncharacterized protein n=1 Tax=Coprinellus micaceus TaxID=71717 RepID=A0A4Y7TJI7_COPMI|nr:hypothetical protein FA13DRAFT_81998 [Coprinellus micaceus]
MMFYSRFLLISFIISFLSSSVVAAPIGLGSTPQPIDSATAQPLSDQKILDPVVATPLKSDTGVPLPAIIHEETHAFDWAPAASNPRHANLMLIELVWHTDHFASSLPKSGTFHEIVRIFLKPATHLQQGHQKRRRLARRHPVSIPASSRLRFKLTLQCSFHSECPV